jgi:glucuronate isomerase
VSDENSVGNAVGGTTSLPVAESLRSDIKTGVDKAQSEGAIRSRVVAKLTEEAVKERVEVLAKALAKREEKAKEIGNVRADHKLRDSGGKVITEAFTDAQFKKREKLNKELSKMDKVLNQAINEGNYEGARKLAGGNLKIEDDASDEDGGEQS